MPRKFFTIDDLYNFCKENKYESFSANKYGAPLIVQSIGTFESESNIHDGLMSVKLKSCHTGKNRNRSGISDETMEAYKDSFKGRPILGAIYKTDTGEYEFRAHDMEIIEKDDEVDIHYIEQPIGVISQTATPYLEYDKESNKNYLMVEGTIFADYSKAAEILERRRTCKCSVEIAVEEMSYNCSEDYLSIDKFHFIGVTILGYEQDGVTEIQEGMAGSKITIDDFSEKRNSMFSIDCRDKLIEVLDKLNITLSNFNIKQSEEEGGDEEMNQFEETVVETTETTEVENTEEVEVVETESETEEVESVEEETVTETASESDDGDVEHEEEKFTKTFSVELSHDDIRYALYNLIGVYEEEDNEWYGIYAVYDSYFVMQGWCNGKFFKQNYSVDGENVSLSGERQEVFMMLLTESEKLEIEDMRKNYSALKEFKDNYDIAQLNAKKNDVFAREEYAEIAECDEFKALVSDMAKYSVEELEVKCDLIFAAHEKAKHKSFAEKSQGTKHTAMRFSVATVDETNKKPYGNLFEK